MTGDDGLAARFDRNLAVIEPHHDSIQALHELHVNIDTQRSGAIPGRFRRDSRFVPVPSQFHLARSSKNPYEITASGRSSMVERQLPKLSSQLSNQLKSRDSSKLVPRRLIKFRDGSPRVAPAVTSSVA